MVRARSYAEIPVVTPWRASIASQKAVPYCEVFSAVMGPMRRCSRRSSVMARQTRPRPYLAMKLMASGVTFSAARVRSPSFSRSSSSTTTIIRPARISSIAVGTSVKYELGVMERCCPYPSARPALCHIQAVPLRRRQFTFRVLMLCTTKQTPHSAHHPSHHDRDHGEKGRYDQGGSDRVLGSEPSQGYRDHVFSRAERDIRNWLRGRGHGYASRRFASVSGQGDGRAQQRRQHLLLRRQLGGGAVGHQGCHRNSNESMKSIPEQIEGGDFIREKLDNKKHARSGNHPPTGKQSEPRRKIQQAGVGQQSESGYRGIEVQPGCEAYRCNQSEEFRPAKFHARQHIRSRPPRQYPAEKQKGRWLRPSQ